MTKLIPIVLKSHKRQLTEVLTDAGLSPADFEWVDIPSKDRDGEAASALRHRHEPFYISIDRSKWNSNWLAAYCPGSDKWTNSEEGSWQYVLAGCKAWAGFVSREIAADSYLTRAMNSPKLLQSPAATEENSPFTMLEQHDLAQQLDQIEERLLQYHKDSDDFRAEVQTGFRILRDELQRGGRTAFRYLVFSTLLSIGLTFLDNGETKAIIDFATQQLNSVTQMALPSMPN